MSSAKKILLLEDSIVSIHSLKKILDKMNVEISIYNDLEKKNDIFSEIYDLAIIDLVIKDGDSIKFLLELKENQPLIPIIIISSMTEMLNDYPEVVQRIDFIFDKPFDNVLVEKTISMILGQAVENRRQDVRKNPIPYCWITQIDKTSQRPQLFESPVILDVSKHGLSFESFFLYNVGDLLLIWILTKVNNENIVLELNSHIRWFKKRQMPNNTNMNIYSYGVEMISQNADILEYQKLVAQIESVH